MKLPIQSLFVNNRSLLVSSKRYRRTPFGDPKRTFEDRNRLILDAHKHKRLGLAETTGRSDQWKLRTPQKPDPIIKKVERKLPPLSESSLPYEKYSDKEVESIQNFETYYDPLFNPHLHEERHRVNPDEEPFDAIYVDSKSEGSQEYTETRNITTPQLWEYVERLARIKIAPELRRRKANEPVTALPSGFVSPPETPPDLPYFICRTRNYLLPVYYMLEKEPSDCCTIVKQVTGDLWKLEEDLRNHLESLSGTSTRILTSVKETDGQVAFRGRHLRPVVDWLHAKGF